MPSRRTPAVTHRRCGRRWRSRSRRATPSASPPAATSVSRPAATASPMRELPRLSAHPRQRFRHQLSGARASPAMTAASRCSNGCMALHDRFSARTRHLSPRRASWIGTPYRHQASLKGVGCDCLGLVRGVWRAVIGAEPEPRRLMRRTGPRSGGEETLADAARAASAASPARGFARRRRAAVPLARRICRQARGHRHRARQDGPRP